MKLNLLPVRIIQGLFSVLVIALSGYGTPLTWKMNVWHSSLEIN